MPRGRLVRVACLTALLLLGGLGGRSGRASEPVAADAVREARGWLLSRDEETRRLGLTRLDVLTRGDPALLDEASVRALKNVWRHRPPREGARAVRLLARSPEGWREWLRAMDEDEPPEIVLAAVDAAGEAPPTATRALVAVVREDSEPMERRALALEALGERPGPAAALLLERPLTRPEPWLLASARALGLGRRGGREVLEPLLALLASSDAAPRVHAWEALSRLTGARLPAEADAWRAWLAARAATLGVPRAEPPPVKDRYTAPTPRHVPTYYGVPIDRPRSRVVFCLDTSQSMYGRGMDQSRRELCRTLLAFPSTYAFDVIAFNENVMPIHGRLVPAHPVVKARTLARVDAFETVSYTNLYDAVETAFGYGHLDAVFLLSDGAPNRGKYRREKRVVEAIAALSQKRIPVHCIAAGEEVFPLLKKIADATGGSFVDAFEFD